MDWKKAHFIGIGGVGMSATAKLLKDAGVVVTGSDETVYEPIASFLQRSELVYQTGYKAENIPADVDLIVIGKNAKLVPESNPEVAAAFGSGKLILSFPEVLARLSAGRENVVVAGSYGKSTSAALLAHVLEHAGKNPSYFIGALPVEGSNAKLSSGGLFVLEGDEYPASNTDPRSKFLLLEPEHLLITPLAHDHFNIFPTPADYLAPFYKLVELAPERVVVCTEGPLSAELISKLQNPVTYGLEQGEYTAQNIVWGERTTFEINGNKFETSLLGAHNIQNIVGVAALVLSRNLMTPLELAAGVASFKGIIRRLDRKSQRTTLPVFEGFGSSYEKAKSAIAAIKLHFPTRNLKIVFEPYTINWRRPEALPQYKDVFAGASKTLILNPGVPSEVPFEDMAAASGATLCATTEDCLQALSLEQNDVVLLLSSGPMQGLIPKLIAHVEQTFPQ